MLSGILPKLFCNYAGLRFFIHIDKGAGLFPGGRMEPGVALGHGIHPHAQAPST